MAGYNELRGLRVKYLSADPANPEDGQVWYNSTTGNLRVQGIGVGAWSSGSSVLTARYGTSGAGTQTAGLMIAGNSSSTVDTYITNTEEYNGSGWANGGALPTGTRSGAGFGTQTAALYAGGFDGSNTAEAYTYNGTSWTGIPALNTARRSLDNMGAGTITAAIVAGGFVEPPYLSDSEEYNGSSWSEGNNLNTARANAMAAGIQTAAFVAGGQVPPESAATENYDGTSWTSSGNLNTARRLLGGGGSQIDGIVFGGYAPPGNQNLVENYDGTSWTANPATLAQARHGGASGSQPGAASSTFYASGFSPASPVLTTNTEEYNFSSTTVTPAAWSAGGSLSTARQRTGGFGDSQTSAVVAAGATAPPASALSATEEYNGSAWTSSGNVNTARFNMTAFGTEPAGVLSGIGTPSVSYGGTTEEYNGSTWTTVNPYAAPGANYRSSCGPQTAALLSGGVAPAPAELNNAVEEYDGTNWTSGTNLPQYQAYNNQAGTQTAAINGGGSAGPAAPGPVSANAISLEYDGSTWTAGPNANLFTDTLAAFNGGIGTQTAAIFSGGPNTGTVRYDGTTFATDASIAAGRGNLSAAGLAPASAGIVFCGSPVPGVGNTVDEYNSETVTTNPASNLSVS